MKTVLLIGGGGTLGYYTAKELLQLNHGVDIICLEDMVSDHDKLRYYKAAATEDFLFSFLENRHYDGIVNFIHYEDVENYKPIHRLLMTHTDHLIFLSSYRVYADKQHPITESAPHLLDVSRDSDFLRTETYALSKAKCERFLRQEDSEDNWTIVRPVISFSKHRFDLVTYCGEALLQKMKNGDLIPLPIEAKNLTAGLDWAGNSGKLIAHLLFKKEAYREAFTVSSAQNFTWGQVAQLYEKLCGGKFRWVSLEEFRKETNDYNIWALLYDRLFDRKINNEKILRVTGLSKSDFLSIEEGIKIELARKEQH